MVKGIEGIPEKQWEAYSRLDPTLPQNRTNGRKSGQKSTEAATKAGRVFKNISKTINTKLKSIVHLLATGEWHADVAAHRSKLRKEIKEGATKFEAKSLSHIEQEITALRQQLKKIPSNKQTSSLEAIEKMRDARDVIVQLGHVISSIRLNNSSHGSLEKLDKSIKELDAEIVTALKPYHKEIQRRELAKQDQEMQEKNEQMKMLRDFTGL